MTKSVESIVCQDIIAQPLGSVLYKDGQSAEVASIFAQLAEELSLQGLKLAGAIQHDEHNPKRSHCDMVVKNLMTGELCSITQDRGPEARGCHLDQAKLEYIVGNILATMNSDIDLLIINKFGIQEATGRGFRQVIEAAVTLEIPILIGIGPSHQPAWHEFADCYAHPLGVNNDEIYNWCLEITGTKTRQTTPHETARSAAI